MAWIECAAKCGNGFHDDERDTNECSEECRLHMQGVGSLELRRDDGGWRHYLNGAPVACGTGLELHPADVDDPDPDDYRSDSRGLRLERERVAAIRAAPPARVRYEAELWRGPDDKPPALLYTVVVGWTAVITAHGGTRLRWPKRER